MAGVVSGFTKALQDQTLETSGQGKWDTLVQGCWGDAVGQGHREQVGRMKYKRSKRPAAFFDVMRSECVARGLAPLWC